MSARPIAITLSALLLSTPLRVEGLSTAEALAFMDVSIEVCSQADSAKPGRYEALRRPPYACEWQGDPRTEALARKRPEYREFSLKMKQEFGALPQADVLAMCASMFEAKCEQEPGPDSSAKKR